MTPEHLLPATDQGIQAGIVALVEAARNVNAMMTATYWEIGHRIVAFEQRGERRAEYGEALIPNLATDLTQRFGRGFGVVNLAQMRRFYLAWPPEAIFQTVSKKSSKLLQINKCETVPNLPALASCFPLPCSAYVRLLSVRSPEARSF